MKVFSSLECLDLAVMDIIFQFSVVFIFSFILQELDAKDKWNHSL